MLQLALVGFEDRQPQGLDALGHRRLVAGFGDRGAAEQQAGSAERNCARNHHVTTRHVHGFPPRETVILRHDYIPFPFAGRRQDEMERL